MFEWQVTRSPVIALTSRGYRRDGDLTRLSFEKAGLKMAAYCELDRGSAVFFERSLAVLVNLKFSRGITQIARAQVSSFPECLF